MVSDAIKTLNAHSAAGPDEIPMIFWNKTRSAVSTPLSFIFSKFVEENFIPSLWKIAYIKPLFKDKGKKSDPQNYRPISLTCALGRILERIISNSITELLTNKISDKQHGFRQNRSTISNLLETYDYISALIDKRRDCDLVLLDLSKAFDKIDHGLLISKLYKLDIPCVLIKFIENFLLHRKQIVRIENVDSRFENITSGVPQGTVLGPLLFSLYINDLLLVNFKSKVLAFADDLKIIGNDSKGVQEDLNQIVKWCESNCMLINKEKCSVIHFGKNNRQRSYNVSNYILEDKKSDRDLGLIVDNKLTFAQHIALIKRKCFSIINKILRIFLSRDWNLLVRIYTIYIRPIVDYACMIYCPHSSADINSVEQIQKYYTRKLFSSRRRPCYSDRLKILNMPSLELHRIHIDLFSVYRILNNSIIAPSIDIHSSNVTSTSRLFVNPVSTDIGKYFFIHRATKLWNSISRSISHTMPFSTFKSTVLSSNFSSYLKGCA
jgi:hypothetical protein